MTLTNEQIRAIFAKGRGISISAKGTIPVKTKHSGFAVERLKGSDELIVREVGRGFQNVGSQHGVITTKEDLNRVLRHMQQQKKAREIMEAVSRSKKKGQQI